MVLVVRPVASRKVVLEPVFDALPNVRPVASRYVVVSVPEGVASGFMVSP
jgi:hypothetical protein